MGRKEVATASEIGKVVWCPHAASLAARGVKMDKAAQKRTQIGTQSHARLTAQVEKEGSGCFIASYAFGPQHEVTSYLRWWRDAYLRRHWFGRIFIASYYFASPKLIYCFGRHIWFKRMSCKLVAGVAKWLQAKYPASRAE